jgi:hypothetical protein
MENIIFMLINFLYICLLVFLFYTLCLNGITVTLFYIKLIKLKI